VGYPARILTAAQIAQAVEQALPRAEAATGTHIPREVVLAIIDRESYPRYNANSYRKEPSGRESFGLMQVLDTTAQGLGFAPAALLDPVTGIVAGASYLGNQLKRYKGDITKAVAAYNAGSARPDGKGGYVTTPGYVDFVLGRVQYWLAQAASSPAAPVALLAAVALGTLWIMKGAK
jgi:soluble lytic murein transglycosylase-like protein